MTYEPCEECGAPLDPQQRYCINCAARRSNGANPSSRYFAAMSKKARRPLSRPPAKPNATSRAAAVGFFALLPIAVALGVVVGRSGSSSSSSESEALLKALRNQEAATASANAGTSATASAGSTTKKGASKQAKTSKSSGKPHEKVVAKTKNGSVHEVTDFHASKQKEEEDTQLVENNPEQTGSNYIKAQQNLPDVIVVGGSGSSSGSGSAGAEP